MTAVKNPLARQSNFDDQNSNMSSQSFKIQHCQKHMVPEEKRKSKRKNKMRAFKSCSPERKTEEKRKVNGSSPEGN